MLNAVNTVMDTHLLTPVGSRPNPAARSESPIKRYLAAGKYRLYPFDHSAKPYFDEACARLNVALSDYSFANNVIWLAQAAASTRSSRAASACSRLPATGSPCCCRRSASRRASTARSRSA